VLSARRDAAAARRFFTRALRSLKVIPAEVVTDAGPVYPGVLDELVPSAWHHVEQYANNPIEADHGQLKHRLRPMRGLQTDRTAQVVIAGHALVQNLRRRHYELGMDASPALRSKSGIHRPRPSERLTHSYPVRTPRLTTSPPRTPHARPVISTVALSAVTPTHRRPPRTRRYCWPRRVPKRDGTRLDSAPARLPRVSGLTKAFTVPSEALQGWPSRANGGFGPALPTGEARRSQDNRTPRVPRRAG
jgi:hypothetical protein